MKLGHFEIATIFDFSVNNVCSLVVENQNFFRSVVEDLSLQTTGAAGKFILSENDEPMSFYNNVELIKDLAPFNINNKSLTTKLTNTMERQALRSDFFLDTQTVLSSIEQLIDKISFEFPFDVAATKINTNALFKAIGLEISDNYDNPLERILDFIEIIRALDSEKLFIFINMRSYFDDANMNLFVSSIADIDAKILLVESSERPLLNNEYRCTIDEDLCEI